MNKVKNRGISTIIQQQTGTFLVALSNGNMQGSVAALISGLIALWLFVWLLREQRFHVFSWYAWALGAGVLIWVGFVGR